MLRYVKSRDFPIHLLAFWWVLWLLVSQTNLNEFIPPSTATVLQVLAFVAAFVAGHLVVKHRQSLLLGSMSHRRTIFQANSMRMQWALRASALGCAVMLLVSLERSGAFQLSFIEYFTRLRVDEDAIQSLSGIRALDVLTKILAFPLSYTIIVVLLANGAHRFKVTLLLCVGNLLAFSYLWQVNYPLIHLFWFFVFFSLLQARRVGRFNKRTLLILLLLVSTLFASAVNRFGGDVLGGLQRYVSGYHLVGFSFYDYQYHDPHSLLHTHSLGRSSLGFLDQVLENFSKLFELGYQSASSQNSTFTNDAVDIGLREVRDFNAFGTFLFGFYRDFHVLGILVGGFVYGMLATHTLRRSSLNWVCGALFLILASSWMVGMMVNPLEQAYFWFSIVAVGAFHVINRGLRF